MVGISADGMGVTRITSHRHRPDLAAGALGLSSFSASYGWCSGIITAGIIITGGIEPLCAL
jgi:hypothetical protein